MRTMTPPQSTRPVRVGLVQINETYRTGNAKREQYQVKDGRLVPKPLEYGSADPVCWGYLPYSVGLLQAYVQKHATDRRSYEFLPIIYTRLPVSEAVARLANADVVGFSTYAWNMELSLRIARALRQQNGHVLIAFGGPQVPAAADEFLIEHPFVDIVCHGEGEQVFHDILEHAADRCWDSIASVSYRRDGAVVTRPRAPRIRDLSIVPSPYLSGVFDEVMRSAPDQLWVAPWETNRGCPYTCTFCDWGSANASKIYRFDMERLAGEVEWCADQGVAQIFVCDANFGILPRDVDIAAMLAKAHHRRGARYGVCIQSAKNAAARCYRIHGILSEAKILFSGPLLAIQSTDRETLKNVKRHNIPLASYDELQRRYARDGIETYTDLIIGLPGETYDSFASGIDKVIAIGQHTRIMFFNCSVLPNAEIGSPLYQRQHGIETVPSRIVQEGEPLDKSQREEVPEFLDTIIATQTMCRGDWARARAFAWMVELLHFDRVLQLAFVTLAGGYRLSYREMVEAFLDADAAEYPICARVADVFRSRARAIQAGEPQFVPAAEYLGVWWRADLYALVRLVVQEKLQAFYDEAKEILRSLAEARSPGADPELLSDAIAMNRVLLCVPFQQADVTLSLSYNVCDYYEGVLAGRAVPLVKDRVVYTVDRTSMVWLSWEPWCLDVCMHYYNRRTAFYYPAAAAERARVNSASGAGEPSTVGAGACALDR